MSLSSALLKCQMSLLPPRALRHRRPHLPRRRQRATSAVKVRTVRAAPALTLRKSGQTDWQSCRNRYLILCFCGINGLFCSEFSPFLTRPLTHLFFSPQLKAVHEQLTALSQGPIIKPKKKKDKKDKKKKKKVEKEKHRRIEEQPKAPKITKAPKTKSTRAAGCPVLPIKKAPSKKNSKSK